MQTINVVSKSGAGWVRAMWSRRLKGYAVPVALLRVPLRGAVRAGERRRVAAAFASYLVMDAAPDAVPIWRGVDGRVTLLNFALGLRVFGLRREFDAEAVSQRCMDAPYFVLTGSIIRYESCGEYCAAADAIQRGRYAA